MNIPQELRYTKDHEWARLEGEILEVNPDLEDSPELVNSDPYGKGWIVKIKPANADDVEGLLSADDYKKLIAG